MRNDLAILACLALALPSLPGAQAGEAKPKDQPAAPPAAGAGTTPANPAGAGPALPAQPPANPATVLAEVVGTVKNIDRGAQRLDVDSAGQTVAVTLDRNTMVYTSRGLGTVLDLSPGAQVRVGRNAKYLAYWVQVRPAGEPEETPVSTPAQGSSPTTGAGPPAEGGTAAPPTGTAPGGGTTTAPGATPGR
jgi:hypothetical protein